MKFYVDPGEFKYPIEIQEFIETPNNDDIPTKTWATFIKIRAKVINTSGKEYIQGQGIGSAIYKKFYIRFPRQEVTTDSRILYNNQVFNITYVNNVDDANKYLEIVAELKK